MCLLDEVMQWDAQHIRCRSGTHRLPDHPLRLQGHLGIACGIEYAAQAMAVHGALAGMAGKGRDALADGGSGGDAKHSRSEVGFLAGLRDVRLHALRLDDIEADLICEALLIAGDHGSALYEFAIRSEAQPQRLLSGRATVVFDANERLRTHVRFKT
jgi:predicted hotdog family 3-hydroxylacyl-ACP dehydratase